MLTMRKRASLPTLLITLTLLTLFFQMSLFFINNKVNDLMDSLVQSALSSQLFHPVILLPIIGFLLIQIVSYALFIAGVWFLSISLGEFFNLSENKIYYLGLILWLCAVVACLSFNSRYFADSFFAQLLREYGWYNPSINSIILITCTCILLIATLVAYLNFFLHQRHLLTGSIFLSVTIISGLLALHTHFFTQTKSTILSSHKPNIIFIGLDSVRPDFTGYFGKQTIATPHVDAFLKSATVFTDAYTPLARTFPAWMSILTGKYPKHNHARTNLADSDFILNEDTLAKHLQQAGYETIYGTDEKRFSNILNAYGFDHVMGPHMGVNDFLIGGLSDFPLTNILINTPIGRFLFPYNYGNRAASITYEPKTFLQLVKVTLSGKHDKPLFLAIHLCVSHWPYTWANDQEEDNFTEAERYRTSVQAVDKQLGHLLTILKADGLLENAVVVLLSDHGTTVGLPQDRIISRQQYIGDSARIKWIPLFSSETPNNTFKLHTIPQFRLDTSYGQGTDVLSLKQYHVLLAIKGFGTAVPIQTIQGRTSLLDIAPTILDFLQLPQLSSIDGISLNNAIFHNMPYQSTLRPLLMETGYKVPGIEEAHISVAKVVRQAINTFEINPKTGLLFVNPTLEKGTNRLKQRAILSGDWLLARYPDADVSKLVHDKHHSELMTFENIHIPAYFVIANIKTGQWSIGLDSPLAKIAPMQTLLKEFNGFYGDEL